MRFWTYKNASLVPEGESQFNFLHFPNPNLGEEGDPNAVLDLGTDVSFTVSLWVRFNSWSGDPALFGNKNWNSGGNSGFVLATDGDGRFQWNYREVGGPRKDYDGAAATLSGGAWHHLVMTVDRGGNATSYIDGLQVDTSPVASFDAEGNWIPRSISGGLSMNLGQDGTGSYTDGGGVGIADGEIDDFGFWRRALSGGEISRIYAAAISGINLSAIADPTTPSISSISPAEGGNNSNPNGRFSATIEDAGTALNPASVKLFLDGTLVAHTATVDGPGKVTIGHSPAWILSPGSSHKYRLEFSDNGAPVVSKSQEVSFIVGNYENIYLPSPVWIETFNAAAEGEVPAGWTLQNFTKGAKAADLNDSGSDSYLDWVVISKARFAQVFDGRRLNVAAWQVVNSTVLQTLADGNLLYGESDNRGSGEYQLAFSPDVDLTGKQDVYLAFNSLYEQNQDSLGAVEYSIDEGATWQPVLYMIDAKDIARNENLETDPVLTLTRPQGDAAKYINPETGEGTDGRWGSFIGVTEDRYETLAPYISGRIDDNSVESKRVEVYRLPLADNQPKVRLRFAHSGTGSWYFGIDNVGIYSIPAPAVTLSGLKLDFIGGRLQSAPSVDGPWTDVPQAVSPYSVSPTGGKGFFRAAR